MKKQKKLTSWLTETQVTEPNIFIGIRYCQNIISNCIYCLCQMLDLRSEWMKERKAKKWLDLERGHIIQVFCWQSLHKILMKNRHVSTCFKNVFCCYVYVILLLFCVVRKSNLNPLFLCTDYTDLTQLDWTVMFWIEMSSQNQLNLNVVQRVAAANSS